MSEGDVSLIRDEDLLRRMWQQTEDFSRKKEIRAHMYRLREERLRNLYSPEPTADVKGSEFSAAQDHVKSFADQSFQSMKSKEVRDAGSPPKEFTYRGQDLKALSNAGWNVESENRTTDDGHTHVKSVHANIEGKYDVDGGRGQFAAVDRHKEAVTEYHDDNSSLKRNETSSNTAAREHVVRQTDDGTQISSTTSSSTSTSKFQQMSSTRQETVPYLTNDDYDLRNYDTNRNEDASSLTRRQQITKTNEYEQSSRNEQNSRNEYEQNLRQNDYEQTVRRSNYEQGELVSRKVDYPDDNTKVIVETRCLPDGTRVTSTKREFRAPVQSTHSEQSYQTRSENKSYSTQQRTDARDTSSKVTRHVIDNRTTDIVDSQRNVDDYDFKRQIADYTVKDPDNYSNVKRYETKVDKTVVDRSKIDDDYLRTTKATDDYSNVQRFDTNVNKSMTDRSKTNDDYSQTIRSETRVNKVTSDKDNYVQKYSTDHQRYETSDDSRETVMKRDDRVVKQKDYKDVEQIKNTEERIHHITKDNKVEEVIERKTSTDEYQTTYQTDYAQKKISNDWSPTHQAWASTLRADTPTATRPSTRASSPGSKTFKSSTSSLRSSVSPDKNYRKPSSRGGSPNKIDRYSPTRSVSDRYSTTHSTHSVSETRTHKLGSPDDRRPPTGRSPTRPGSSPERKPQERHQRPSASPEKVPQNFSHRSSISPDRRPAQKTSPTSNLPRTGSPTRPLDNRGSPTKIRESPERKPTHHTTPDPNFPYTAPRSGASPERPVDSHPKDTFKRPSQSPERKPGSQKPAAGRPSPTSDLPRSTSPSRPYLPTDSIKRPAMSPERKPGYQSPSRGSTSPDRKPGYMRPTASTTPTENLRSPTKSSDRTSPTKHTPSSSPDRRPQDYTKTTSKIQEDHYKFIDEETKMFTRVDHTNRDKSSSPSRKSPSKDTPDFCDRSVQRRSPSPKEHVTFADKHDQVDNSITTTIKMSDITDKTIKYSTPKIKDSDKTMPREQSPPKYGTYDKKKPYSVTEENVTTTTIKDSEDVKYDSLTRRDKSPKNGSEQPTSPTKKSPRNSVSPVKSPTKDTKYKYTADFLATEKTTEEINKKTTKDRPRQLVTPSSSPTRKPKPTDTEPSTGQSSPTTSVSGFVYFGSPRTGKTVITDLDDQEFYSETHTTDETTTTYKRPESLDFKRSPSPSKIPCRSPSPEKRVSPSKDSLPRKSSLKKPSTDINQPSPIEKPPTSFRVSPTEELKDFPEHKIIKKDRPEGPDSDAPGKPKPPLERRETYEDRCRKILGMTDDSTTTETITKQISYLKEPEANLSSPSVSPCRSPAPREMPFDFSGKKPSNMKPDVTDFITHEQENIIRTTTRHDATLTDKKVKIPREASPTKLQDIITTKEKSPERKPSQKPKDSDNSRSTSPSKHMSPERAPGNKTSGKKPLDRISPDKTPEFKKTTTAIISKHDETFENVDEIRTTKNTERKTSQTSETITISKDVSPSAPSLTPSMSERKPRGDHPKESPTRPGYNKISTSMIAQYDSTSTVEDIDETEDTRNAPSRPLDSSKHKSPTRASPEKKLGNRPKESSPSTPGYMKTTESVTSRQDTMSSTKDLQNINILETQHTHFQIDDLPSTDKSPGRKPTYNSQQRIHETSPMRSSPEKQLPHKYPKESPTRESPKVEKTPGYMKTTSSHLFKQETTSTSENIDEISTSETKKHIPSDLPTRRTSKPGNDFDHKSKESVSPDRKREHQQPSTTKPTRTTPKRDDSPQKPSHLDKGPSDKPRNNKTSPRASPERKPESRYSKEPSPTRHSSVRGHVDSTTCMTEDIKTTSISKVTEREHIALRPSDTSPTRKGPKSSSKDHPRTESPSKLRPENSADKPSSNKYSTTSKPVDSTSSPKSSSPDRKPSYMRPTASVKSKFESTTTEDFESTEVVDERHLSPRSSVSPPRRTPNEPSKTQPSYLRQPEETRQLRTPSPTKKIGKVTEVSTDFLMSEREQEILDRVQQSLRKLSPERKERSPSREKSPSKTTTSLQDIDITTHTTADDESVTEYFTDTTETRTTKTDISRTEISKDEKPKDQKVTSKPSSRTVSPTKKPSGIVSPTKVDKGPESPSKTRSISPKKPLSPTERPHSPQVSRASGIKPKENIPSHLTRKPTPATLNITKIDKTLTDVKKTTSVGKQNSFTKTTTTKTSTKIQSPTGRPTEPDSKRALTPKGIRDTGPKHIDTKVTRTTSDITIKSKKTSPQRMKSKPEIQVSDMSTTKTTSKIQKREPHSKLPTKPKSATTLNTSTDDDDIIIDVQQSKSSRENSPDRICPTPVNFAEDVGTPRYPDEVKEPDDELRRRAHHTIHETESIVDDIVEICEDDELFVRKTQLTEEDESLLSVTDKVSRFTKGIDTVTKPKDTTMSFKDTERRVHSDFVEEHLKSDECLLSVSEKVNKFAKGPRDTKDSRSPSRKVVDEYDTNTVYQDDYTKLSVHDKAHLFVETAENVKTPKAKPTPQKIERPDLTDVDESLKSDDCLLSVSDKVHKFVKTAEQFLTETQEIEEKEQKIKDQHDKIMKKIIDNVDDEPYDIEPVTNPSTFVEDERVHDKKTPDRRNEKPAFAKDTTSSYGKVKEYSSPNLKPTERAPTVKITTLRSSEAVKKAKALFENIASTTQKTKETTHTKTTKLTDIGVMKKSPKTDSTTVLHPSVEEGSPNITDVDSEVDIAPHTPKDRPSNVTTSRPHHTRPDDKPRSSPSRLTVQSPEVSRPKSPIRHTVETVTTTRTTLTKYPTGQRAESPNKPEKVPGYLRPTKTSQIKEETKLVEEAEVSSRRGSGKFGVELRRTSIERSTASSERRRSVEHPCIEDIFDLDLLEQMLEKVVGYEQRRRIRAQIRIARKKLEEDHVDTTTHIKTTKHTVTKSRSPERPQTRSPERVPKTTTQKTVSPDRQAKSTPQRTVPERSQPKEHAQPVLNGHTKEPSKITDKRQRPHSPEKPAPKSVLKTKSPVRQASPDKKTRTQSPNKTATPKTNRFNEYASAYMKKVGLSEADKIKFAEAKAKKATEERQKTVKRVEEHKITEEYSMAKNFTERTSSKDVIEVIQVNGSSKRSPSPEKRLSPERKPHSPERMYERTPSPTQKQPKSESTKKETIIKTVYDIEKKIPQKQVQADKPSWVTNRNLKKITSENRTFSSKKIEEKPKYRAPSPSKVISKPIDVITSSYGPGPLDADGKPLFGIRALRNGSSNYQVKGTVIRQEYHSRNGGEPEGTVSVTAYSTEPEDLERLLQGQGEAPSRIHGLAAITTTKKFGGDTGTTLTEVHGREDRAAIDQFTHTDRKVTDIKIEDITDRSFDRHAEIVGDTRRIESRREEATQDRTRDRREEKMDKTVKKVEKKGDRVQERKERMERTDEKKTVRQSSVKSLTEKYIKSTNESSKAERTTYPKAGLILRTANMKDSVSSDSSAHAGLVRTDSEHSLASVEDTVVTTERVDGGVRTITTTRTHGHVTHSPVTHHVTQSHVTHSPVTHLVTQTHVTHGPVTQTHVTQTQTQSGQRVEKSFLDSSTKVTGVQDILTRMKNADIVIQEGDTSEDTEARALLNKFLGATVLMAGMQNYVTEKPSGKVTVKQETVRTSSSGGKVTSSQSRTVEDFDVDQCWDERVLRKLLDECNDYEQRRRLRARIRTLMAEQEACASAVTEALAAAGEAADGADGAAREEEEVTVTSSVRRNSSEKTVSSSTTTTKTSKVIESMTRPAPKPVSPFAKFRQLEKQNSVNSPKM